MNTFFFAMTSLELKHRAPKVTLAVQCLLRLASCFWYSVFCIQMQSAAVAMGNSAHCFLTFSHGYVLNHDSLHLQLVLPVSCVHGRCQT